jgi:uncharacterized protein YggE
MRRIWIVGGFVLVAAVGMALSTGNTRAQPAGGNEPAHRRVTVSGTATVAVKPDTARVSFAVKAMGMDLKTASAECDKKAAAVEKAIKGLELGGLEIKKGPLNFTMMNTGFPMPFVPPVGMPPGGFQPPMQPAKPPMGAPPGGVEAAAPPGAPPGGPPAGGPPGAFQPPMGFGPPGGPGMPGWGGGGPCEVTRTFTVVAQFGKEGGAGKLDDIVAVADKILVAAATAGATEVPVFAAPAGGPLGGFGMGGPGTRQPAVSRIEFSRANMTALRQEAIKAAVADALANARIAAGAANLTTKDIVSITDQGHFGPFGLGGQAAPTGRGEVLGETELTMTLSVTFSY